MPNCAICSWSVRPVDALACRLCHVLYHPQCWARTGTCAIYGCGWTEPDPRHCRVVYTWDGAGWGVPLFFVLAAAGTIPMPGLSAAFVGLALIWMALGRLWVSRSGTWSGKVRRVRRRGEFLWLGLQLPGGRRLFVWLPRSSRVRPGDLFCARGTPRRGRLAVRRISVLRPRPLAA